jgi:hypothetical protein
LACDVPPRECLEWHIKPHLEDPRRSSSGDSYRARCPAHDDGEHSFGVSLADIPKQRIVWNCFACKNRVKTRRALIAAGIDPGCLPLTATEKEELLDRLYRIATADTVDHGAVRFSIVAALEGHRDLPAGAEVDRIAGLARTHRATGYRARRAARPTITSTANPSSYTQESNPVNLPTSEAGRGSPGDVA